MVLVETAVDGTVAMMTGTGTGVTVVVREEDIPDSTAVDPMMSEDAGLAVVEEEEEEGGGNRAAAAGDDDMESDAVAVLALLLLLLMLLLDEEEEEEEEGVAADAMVRGWLERDRNCEGVLETRWKESRCCDC